MLTWTSRRLTTWPDSSVMLGRSGIHLLSPSTTYVYRYTPDGRANSIEKSLPDFCNDFLLHECLSCKIILTEGSFAVHFWSLIEYLTIFWVFLKLNKMPGKDYLNDIYPAFFLLLTSKETFCQTLINLLPSLNKNQLEATWAWAVKLA